MPRRIDSSAELDLLDRLWSEPVDRSVLANGLTVIVKPDRSAALASVQVWVRTGSIHEGAESGAGLSHYLEHMLFKGTSRRAGREISATVQAHGGYINAYTTFDRTVYYVDLPSEHAPVAIDILADAVLGSTLPADEVARERDVILREIAMTRDDPDQRLWENLFSAAFREHPYRHPVIGYKDVFSAVSREALVAYYRRRYCPNNMVLVVVGDVEPEAIRAEAEARFGSAPRMPLEPVFVPAEPPQLAPRSVHRFETVELSRAVLSWPVPGLAHPDAPALDLLALILGAGDSSVLWQEIREKRGLVHAIDASCWNPGEAGLFCVSFTCDPEKRAAAAAAVERTLARRAARGFTPAEIRKAYRQMVVAEVNTRKTMGGQASRLGVGEVVVGDLGFARGYFERLRAVTPADLRRLLRSALVEGPLTSVSINPQPAASVAAACGAAARPARSGFETLEIPGGARLLLRRDPRLPNLHLRLSLNGGPVAEAAGKRGASGLLSTVLTRDTLRRDAAAVARRIESVGGHFSGFAGNNSLGLSVEVLPTDAVMALAVLSEAVLEPGFRASSVAIEREAQLAQLKQDADDVVTFARKLLRRKFFGAHPLALDTGGDEAGVESLGPEDLSGLFARMLLSGNAVLAAAGDFDRDELEPALRALLARVPAGSAPARGSGIEAPAEAGEFVVTRPCEQAVVLQAFPGAALAAPDFYAGEVLDEVFSGMASRLFERVREEKALAYFIRSSRVSGLDAAMFSFVAGTQPGREGEVHAEIDAEIARVASGGVAVAEIDRCRARLKAGRRQSLQTNSSLALHASLDVLQGRPANDWMDYDARVDAVTVDDLAAFARRRLDPALRVKLVVRA